MNLMQRYQRNQGIISQSKSDDSSQSQIQKLYMSSIHRPVLDPLDPPSTNSVSSSNSYPINYTKPVSNYSRPIKIESKKPFQGNQCAINSNQIEKKNDEKQYVKKNEIIETNKINHIIPSFDFERNKFTIYSKYNNDTLGEKRQNIELPQIEKLPPIFKTNSIISKEDDLRFKLILKAKFNLVNTKLDFSNLEMDRPAKQIRLSTINEICQTFIGKNANFKKENGEEQLNPNQNYEIFKMIFDFLSSIIFRPISEPFKKFTFSDDLILINNLELGQTSLCYNALNYVLRESKLKAHLKSQLYNRNFVKKLFQRFYVPDEGERSLLAQFVLDIINYSNEDMHSFVIKKCYNELVMCTQGPYRLHYVLMPTLSVLYNIYCGNVKNKETDLSVYYDDYYVFILPVLRSLHFITCSQQMTQIIDLFVTKGTEEVVLKTVMALVKYFPLTKSFKSIIFISLLANSLPLLSKESLKKVAKKVFAIATLCTTSPNASVSQASVAIWSIRCIENFITENSKMVLPQSFVEINNALENADLNSLNESTIADVMSRFERLDSKIFNELNCSKNERKNTKKVDHFYLNKGRASKSTLASWRLIAREAARNDFNIDLASALSSIGKSFIEDESLSKFEENEKSDFSLPSVNNADKTNQPRSAPQTKGKFMFLFGLVNKFSRNKKHH